MADEETTEQFLARRERELMNRATALRGQLTPIEAELAKVQRMRALLADEAKPVSELAKIYAASPSNSGAQFPWSNISSQELLASPFANRTIKDLVIQALLDAFPNGARTVEIRDFIRTGYSRDVGPDSLRTQLHRLKAAGILGQEPNSDLWNFRDGQRALYARYDHPSSRRDMAELRDDPVPGVRLHILSEDKK